MLVNYLPKLCQDSPNSCWENQYFAKWEFANAEQAAEDVQQVPDHAGEATEEVASGAPAHAEQAAVAIQEEVGEEMPKKRKWEEEERDTNDVDVEVNETSDEETDDETDDTSTLGSCPDCGFPGPLVIA